MSLIALKGGLKDSSKLQIIVRNTRVYDFTGIQELCRRVYPDSPVWTNEQLASHLKVFPEGQLVAVDQMTGQIVGMASSLIVNWDEYELSGTWRDFTDKGFFTNHDLEFGGTLYGAEIMVDPRMQGKGVGGKLYRAREKIAKDFNLIGIRAGARLRGYHEYAEQMSAAEYVSKVVSKQLFDPTLSFQLRKGFEVIAVTGSYLRHDPESLGWAAVIEWRNPEYLPDVLDAHSDLSIAAYL